MDALLTRLVMIAASAPAVWAGSPSQDCTSTLCRLVAVGRLPILRWPDFSDYRIPIQKFYEQSGYAPQWVVSGGVTGQGMEMIEAFQAADAKGLNPGNYDGPRWENRITRLHDPGNPDLELEDAQFDLALTVCLMRYLTDLHSGRANPGLFPGAGELAGRQSSNSLDDLAGFIRQRVVHAGNVGDVLTGVEPPYEGYRRTQRALQRYLALAREENVALLPATKKPIEPGSSYVAAAQLADLLRGLGDLPAPLTWDSDKYEGPLVTAVQRFQTRHGLEPDGRVGQATLAALNTPLSHRVRQLQLTLERWRWMPHSYARPPIVVNIPEFLLRALNSSYLTELEMKVVVGGASGHQTPLFAADLKYVVFRPYWDVPVSIQRAELVPKLDQDRSYLIKNGYEVVDAQRVVSNGVVDENILAQLRSAKLRVRQVPGPQNALGLVKFVFPNEHEVYMHATPATELFLRTRRDFSHGCIRVEMPEELAAWVLRDKPEWTPERIQDAMNGESTVQVALEAPIPVLIVYATAVVLENGEVRFFNDIYGQDEQLGQLLSKGYPSRPWKPTTGARDPRPRE